MRHIRVIAVLILAFAGSAIAAEQSDYTKLVFPSPTPDLMEIVGVSPIIFTGTVVGMRYGTHEGSTQPYTFVKFEGIKFLRKDAKLSSELEENTLEISHIGGIRKSDMHFIEVSFQPSFNLGERYLVFLRGGGWRFNPVAGGRLGVFRLWGPVEEDPLILDLNGHPIAAFKEGRPVYSRVQKAKEKPDEFLGQGREEPLTREQLEKANPKAERPMSSKEVEEKEKKISAKERELDVPSPPEYDSPRRYQDRLDRVLKLSELTQLIERYMAETRGKYRAFEQLYARPVPPAKEIKTITPESKR